MEKAERQSNIELLRILTMCGVVILHYNNESMGGGFAYATGLNLYVLYFLESIFACAVNLFVLISGYFMCEQQRRTLAKPFELLVQVVLFNELLYFASTIVHHEPISIKHIMGHLIPANWFVILYITLYLISPFLNILLSEAERTGILKKLLILLVLLFSVYPTLVDILIEATHRELLGLSSVGMYGSQWGYTIVNFCVLYCLGAYLRKQTDSACAKRHFTRFILMAIILTAWVIIGNRLNINAGHNAWEYCNPLVIGMAAEAFQLFQKIDLGCHWFINRLAKSSFTVYLLHTQFFRFLLIPKYVIKNPMIMLFHVMLSAALIYFMCTLIHWIYKTITEPLFNIVYKKCSFLKRSIL